MIIFNNVSNFKIDAHKSEVSLKDFSTKVSQSESAWRCPPYCTSAQRYPHQCMSAQTCSSYCSEFTRSASAQWHGPCRVSFSPKGLDVTHKPLNMQSKSRCFNHDNYAYTNVHICTPTRLRYDMLNTRQREFWVVYDYIVWIDRINIFTTCSETCYCVEEGSIGLTRMDCRHMPAYLCGWIEDAEMASTKPTRFIQDHQDTTCKNSCHIPLYSKTAIVWLLFGPGEGSMWQSKPDTTPCCQLKCRLLRSHHLVFGRISNLIAEKVTEISKSWGIVLHVIPCRIHRQASSRKSLSSY